MSNYQSVDMSNICPGSLDLLIMHDSPSLARSFGRAWRKAIPRVTPFYAIKCNPEPAMLRLLMALGAGFDCASKVELATVLAIGKGSGRGAAGGERRSTATKMFF